MVAEHSRRHPVPAVEGLAVFDERRYGETTINERHRHRFEFNPEYRDRLEAGGLLIAGTSPNGSLVEIVEIPTHPFYVAVQFHPEFLSRPNQPYPLFSGFVAAALKKKLSEPETLTAESLTAEIP